MSDKPDKKLSPEGRYHAARASLESRGQGHVLRWWNELSSLQRESLLADLESLRWEVLDPAIATHVLRKLEREVHVERSPPIVNPQIPMPGDEAQYQRAKEIGHEAIAQGKVAAFTVAGGQGTRLGFDGPKGALPVTPVGERSLFELFAKTVHAVWDRYGSPVPWYVMTSPANHEESVRFLSSHGFFGLPPEDVVLFRQGTLPAFDYQGKLLLTEKYTLALAPDGHGGSLSALVRSGSLADMQRRGIEIISYFQVDNPLVKPFDPLFIGLHVMNGSEMSSKAAAKVDDLEKVGTLCLDRGRLTVVEYSDFPQALARARNPDGSRRFNAGNLAIHLINVSFVDRVIQQSFQLPLRRADKIVPFVDERGVLQRPTSANAIKLETFVFDVLPLANHALVLEVDRAEEFSPAKNATGVDSLETAKRDQVRRACRWLDEAGVHVPRKPDGEPDVTVAISPKVALSAEDLQNLPSRIPKLSPGMNAYIE